MTNPNQYFYNIFGIGYAYNRSKGKVPIHENSTMIQFATGGIWRRLFWKFYYKSDKNGYLDE
jgi:hypothetical protein